jgi:L-rhamnose isomerase/sugar isomerase
MVNRLTGICPTVAIHIPWDRVDDWDALRKVAAGHGVKIGAINPNLFQDDEYMLGSLAHPSEAIRRRAVDHVIECIDIAKKVGSSIVSLWLADGTNYPGQDDLRSRSRRLRECLGQIYHALPAGIRLLVEYKFFEPGFYSTDLPDWGTAYAMCLDLGPQAEVLVDTGHHAQGVNIEQIVAQLLDRARLGGFHFNARKYADDDLIVGSTNPFELFLIFSELVAAEEDADEKVAATARNVAYMIDQAHNIEPKLEAMVQSVVNIQTAHAKALLVDRTMLRDAQAKGDVLGANRVLVDAYESDVRPLLAEARKKLGIDPDPLAALRRSGYVERVARERGTVAAGSGYPGA